MSKPQIRQIKRGFSANAKPMRLDEKLVWALIALLLLTTLGYGIVMAERSGDVTDTGDASAQDAPVVDRAATTQEESVFAQAVMDNDCDGTNCFVYIAYPPTTNAEAWDRGPFVRLLTPDGDDVASDVRGGQIFAAVDVMHCRPESRCGISPKSRDDGTFTLLVIDAPLGYETASREPALHFPMSQ
ncbi:hypothetical protein KJ673_03540 [Patescibacteria group bacterium]|nr:hypothetical protein [Patescibacteria group bacterium]MBU4453168.1 hypothetical protein [Patescibacteria group bacterium]MCG2687583.1 hypothetical protein [Candidatus Parcubacteria bacterium]